jgi:dsDNA-specific endonuclease/ATPase MutS2
MLQRHGSVRRFHDAMPEEGGDGVTVAEFE